MRLDRLRSLGTSLALASTLVGGLAPGAAAGSLPQPECGGLVPCRCGDRVVEDYVLTEDLGPCTWDETPTPGELVGLRVDSDVTLDCAGHSILGPADAQKEEFGIRTGSSSRPVSNATIRGCTVSGFWWGIYVAYSDDVVVEDSVFRANGWFSDTENGTGYGIDVANSSDVLLRRNQIVANGNEGLHLSSSARVRVEDNVFADNAFEQVYVIGADRNTIVGNRASGGRQGLEMRDSDDNVFSYNEWRGSKKQWLEDHNDGNTFLYDHFEGRLAIDDSSNGNVFTLCSLWNPGGECSEVRASDNTFVKSHFTCRKDVDTTVPLVLDRAVGSQRLRSKQQISQIFPGCSGDMGSGDGDVDAEDQAVVAAAFGSRPGDPAWNPEADLDHDGEVDATDAAAVAAQLGPCSFANKPPRARVKAFPLVDNPPGQSDLYRIDATRSDDDRGTPIRYELYAENDLTGEEVFRESLDGIAPEAAVFDATYPPGRYSVYVYVTDDLGLVSKPKRLLLSVR